MANDLVANNSGGAAQRDFDTLIGPWCEAGYRLAISMLGDPDAARDVLQDSSLRAWRSMGRLRDPQQARAWFLSIVANRCRSTMHHNWWGVARFGIRSWMGAFSEESVVQTLDLDQAMKNLSPEDRALLHMRFYLDLTVEEVGRVLGISAGAARSRIYRAAHRLRPGLTEEDLQ